MLPVTYSPLGLLEISGQQREDADFLPLALCKHLLVFVVGGVFNSLIVDATLSFIT